MSLSSIRSLNFPPSQQLRGVVVGWIALIGTVLALISPRTWAFVFPIVAATYLFARFNGRQMAREVDWRDRTTACVIAFLAYCALSSLWSSNASAALGKLAYVVLVAAGTIASCRLIRSETSANIIRLAEGLWTGLLVGLLYVLIDLMTKGGLQPTYLKEFMRLSTAEITRAITPVTLLLGPSLIIIIALYKPRWRNLLSSIFLIVAASVVLISPHETSKLALFVWLAIFGLGLVSRTAADRGLMLGWFAVCWMVIPLSLTAYRLEAHKSAYLQLSAQQRISIWYQHAKKVSEAPLLGHGFNQSHADRPEIKDITEMMERRLRRKWHTFRSIHPHNAYLQVWYELGAVGMILFSSIGFCILATIRRLQATTAPLVQATFAAGATVAFSSYGMWQYWFLGMFGFTAFSVAVAIRAGRDLQS